MKKIVGLIAGGLLAAGLSVGTASADEVNLTPSVACPAGTEASVVQLIDGVYVYDEADSDPLATWSVNPTENVAQPQPDGSVVYTRFQVTEARAKGNPRAVVDVAVNGEFIGFGAPQTHIWAGFVTDSQGEGDVTPIVQEAVYCTQV